MTTDRDGGVLITGSTDSGLETGRDVLVLKTDSEGVALVEAALGGVDQETGHAIIETSDGGLGIAGLRSPSTGTDSESTP